MVFFLKLVGAAIVAFLVLGFVSFILIKWKLKKWFSGVIEQVLAAAQGGVPPFRLKLEPWEEDEEFSSLHEEDVLARAETLQELDFEHIGDFNSEDAMFCMRAYINRPQATYAVIYDHVAAGVWCDIVRTYQDGTGWSFATAKEHGLDTAPGKVQKFFPDMELEDVVRLFWKEAPAEGTQTVEDHDFARYFEKKYAEEMNWHIQRGGPSEQEIQRIAELADNECTPEMVSAIQKQWRVAISEFLSETAIKQFNRDNNVAREDAEKTSHRIVAIHDRMPAATLMSAFDESFFLDEDDDEDDDDPVMARWRTQLAHVEEWQETVSARQAFGQLLDQTDKRNTFEMLGTVSKPIAAEIWLRPESDDEYEDDESEAYDDELDSFSIG